MFHGAGVAELVDALDLGSSDQKSYGFKSLRPHHLLLEEGAADIEAPCMSCVFFVGPVVRSG